MESVSRYDWLGLQTTDRLLLACGSIRGDDAINAELDRLLSSGVDADSLMKAARGHGVTPLVFTRLQGRNVPPDLSAQLQQDYLISACHTQSLTRELTRVLTVLEAQAIPVLCFKGPALAVAAYGSVAMRMFADLDILIHPHDAQRAIEALLQTGYEPGHEFTPKALEERLNLDYDFQVVRDDRYLVELHWAFAKRRFGYALDMNRVWSRATPLRVDDATVSTIHVEDLLLVLCVHGTKHRWNRLKWICDVAHLVQRHPDIHWHDVLSSSAQIGCQRTVLLGLYLAHRLLGLELQEEVAKLVVDHRRRLDALTASVVRWLFFSVGDDVPLRERAAFRFAVRERLGDTLRHAWRRVWEVGWRWR